MTLENTMSQFQIKLKKLMDEYVHYTYKVVKQFPKEELYVASSQLRRASMSVILNFVEGYARRCKTVQLNFYEIAYGSLGESRYLFHFALVEQWIEKKQYDQVVVYADEIGRMLWSEIKSTEKNINQKNK